MEVAKSENTKQMIRQGAEENEVFGRFAKRLEDNPLPEFETIQKYFTKSGGYGTSDETGFHFLFFTMKPSFEQE